MRPETLGPAMALSGAERGRPRLRIDFSVLRDPAWLQWAVVLGLLVAHLRGAPYAVGAAVAICGASALLVALRRRSLRPYGAQIPLGYLLLLLAVSLPALRFLLYLPLAGTIVRILTGYCAMSRLLMLMPWNREEPLTFHFVHRVWLAPQVGGGILRWFRLAPPPAEGAPSAPLPVRIASCRDR